jgi:hypothetical protein
MVGYGPDHEPLVRDVEPVARISETALQQAKQCYEELFEVGRDSRSA